jgi:hypothetical protein
MAPHTLSINCKIYSSVERLYNRDAKIIINDKHVGI